MPSYVSYLPCVQLAYGVPVVINLKEENEFRLTKEELLEHITDKTKLLIMPFPNNPTGAIMPRKDLEEIAKICVEKDIFVISDEIYAELSYYGERHVSIAEMPGMKERTVVINGFSKAFAHDRMETRICLCTGTDSVADAENPSVCHYVCTDHKPVCGCGGIAKR